MEEIDLTRLWNSFLWSLHLGKADTQYWRLDTHLLEHPDRNKGSADQAALKMAPEPSYMERIQLR